MKFKEFLKIYKVKIIILIIIVLLILGIFLLGNVKTINDINYVPF